MTRDERPDPAAASPAEIARRASAWVVRRDRGLSAAEAAELAAWRRADPRHEAAWAEQGAAWRKLDALQAETALQRMAEAAWQQAQARRKFRPWRVWAARVAAVAVLAGGIGAGRQWFEATRAPEAVRPVRENYRVLACTAQRKLLPDGTVVELNGDSRIELAYTATERRVQLVAGEAHFVVVANPERPFVVAAGRVAVRAVGTAFNVKLAAEKIEVLVTEGKVKLERPPAAGAPAAAATPVAATPALVQGQRAVITVAAAAAEAVEVAEVDRAAIEAELGWQSTRLVFNNTPLDEVVAGFNRYNTHRLTLGDPKLKERALTGVFRSDNLDGFVRLLRASVDVKAEPRTPTETVLLPVR
jgi:transmembrane sensor